MKKFTLLVLCTILFFNMASAKNIFVDPINGVDTRNGSTWELAVKSLSVATNNANTSFVAGDNIYVKGAVYNLTGSFTTVVTANYYGGCQGAEVNISQSTAPARPLTDVDGNGIIEPWEFQYPTTLNSTANCVTGNITALTVSNAGYTFDGFTFTHTAINTTAYYLRSINVSVANVKFTNCTMKNSAVTATSTSFGTGTAPFGLFFQTVGGIMSNCLVEKNSLIYNGTANLAVYPFISVAGSATQRMIASNCVVRNNIVTANYNNVAVTTANHRSMLISVNPAATYYTTIKNWLIYNNEMVYNPTGTSPATIGIGASLQLHYAASALDSVINCTIANNKVTNITCAGMRVYNNSGPTHRVLNNVFWNNKVGTTISNVDLTNFQTISLFTKNITNGGNTATTDNGTSITANDFTLSDANDTGNSPLFKTLPTTTSGYNFSDNTIATSVWKLQSAGSYLYGKGTSLGNNTTDKDGKNFAATPSVGAYEYSSTALPVITWSQTALNLLITDAAQTLTTATSTITPSSTPAGSAIVYVSDNPSVVTVSGTTLAVVGPGTTTIRAQQVGNGYYDRATDVTQTVTVSIPNAGFEDVVANFTTTENTTNVLMRVAAIQDANTQISSPVLTSTVAVSSGLWVKKAPNTAYIKGVVTTSDFNTGTSCLNLRIGNGTTNVSLDTWSNAIAFQKLSLTNIQKYTVSFWAKIDPTASNVASNVTVVLTDNTKMTNLTCAIPLTGGTSWTQYSATFDIPAFRAAYATADFSTAYVGVAVTTTYNSSTLKTNYSGVLFDDISVSPASAATIAITASAAANGNVTNGGVYVSGTNATLVAAPSAGYRFVNWTEAGNPVSTSATYTFQVSAARTLVANFELIPVYNTTITFNAGGTVNSYTSGDIDSSPQGAQLVFVITPNTGMGINSILYNGTEVKTQLTNLIGATAYYGGTYTAPALTGAATLVVTFEVDPTTSVENVRNDFQISSMNKSIEIKGANFGDELSVYNFTGSKLRSERINSSTMLIALSQGVYIVKIADCVKKVLVK